MWLPIIICLGVVALLLGPILLMQPSAGQRREARLRQRAAEQGLRVHLQVPPAGTEVPRHIKSVPMYCLPWTEQGDARHLWSLVKKKYEHELHCAGQWDWSVACESRDVNAVLPALDSVPPKVVAVAGGPQGLCVYWSEIGPETDVDDIAKWLRHTLDTLKGS
ncbi:MAG: hypothetical protein ACRBBW_17030 [Cellvibrionaceae bacterium]